MASPALTGDETLVGGQGTGADCRVLDFWRWAFSDLRANDVRGVFAEWLVARILDLDPPTRDSWAAYDLITPAGVAIEVKAAGYLQSWAQKGPSRIQFGGLSGRTWDSATGFAEVRTYNADLYVFCVQIEQDEARWSALDLDQWRFYLVRREQLAALGVRSISLASIEKLCPALTASEFRSRAREAIADRTG